MKKIQAGDPVSMSHNIVAQNIAQLRSIFPEAWTEGKLDFDVLKQLLGGAVDDREEKYGLNWHGKRNARRLALTPSLGTLRPSPEESVDWDKTRNLMIEGDNLEVLKLLQKSYAGKVKLAYLDPPYNTGKDFVYPDDFRDNIKNYQMLTGQVDSDGRKISSNTESGGRFHSDWLNMIYPRLKLTHSLLRHDGAIFVSCDEGEHPRLRLALDDIFGEENFITDMVWAAGRKNDSRLISVSHEYIVCYAKNASFLTENKIEWRQRKKGLEEIYRQYTKLQREYGNDYSAMTEAMKIWYKGLADGDPAKSHKHYCHVDTRGLYFPDNISWPGGGGPKYEVLHPKTNKPVSVPSRGWMTSDPEKMKEWIADDRVHFGADENAVPCIKSYLKDREYQAPYSVFYQDGRSATKRLRELMGGDCFDFPKDEFVLQEIIGMMTSGDDLILDAFAGSGTTGHAVMEQNQLDGGSRRYILIQLPETISADNSSQVNAVSLCESLNLPLRISELTKERLRRVAGRLKQKATGSAFDFGFRVFRLDSSNVKTWEANKQTVKEALLESIDHLKTDRSESDFLYELVLKLGLDLCVPIDLKRVAQANIMCVGLGAMFVCLADRVGKDDVDSIANSIIDWHKKLRPAGDSAIVFKDSGFVDDVSKTNLAAILTQRGFLAANIRSL